MSRMDDIVKQAMAKWPNVPHAWGWLGLDARGNWWLRDAEAQAAGGFASGAPGARGEMLRHEKLIDFIQRNYAADADGQWYFQNGPQRVYVELEAAPWVWRVADAPQWPVSSHTGLAAQVLDTWLDECGRLFLNTDLGFGLVHTMDMGLAALAVEAGQWQPRALDFAQMPARFAYQLKPVPNAPPKTPKTAPKTAPPTPPPAPKPG